MFMKKIILLLSLILMGFGAFSQVSSFDSRLYARFSEEDLLEIQRNNPVDIEYKNWFVENAFVIKEIENPESSNYPKLKYFDKETKLDGAEVNEYNPETFNVMECSYELLAKSSNVYRLGNTGKIIVFYSREDLIKLFNEYRRAHNENN